MNKPTILIPPATRLVEVLDAADLEATLYDASCRWGVIRRGEVADLASLVEAWADVLPEGKFLEVTSNSVTVQAEGE